MLLEKILFNKNYKNVCKLFQLSHPQQASRIVCWVILKGSHNASSSSTSPFHKIYILAPLLRGSEIDWVKNWKLLLIQTNLHIKQTARKRKRERARARVCCVRCPREIEREAARGNRRGREKIRGAVAFSI